MLETKIEPFLKVNFNSAYKNLLVNNIYNSLTMYNQLLSKRESRIAYNKVVKEYFNTLYAFYHANNNVEEYDKQLQYIDNNEKLREYIKDYEKKTNDKNLYKFLMVYGYCVEQLNSFLKDKYGDFDITLVPDFFSRAKKVSAKMFKVVNKDIEAGNYWWLRDTATTLRRQLEESIILINTERLQKLFDKYFPTKFDAQNIKKVDGIELIKQLDMAMYNKYQTKPYYFWWEANDGKKVLKMAANPPESGVYTFVTYQNLTAKEVENKGYYL